MKKYIIVEYRRHDEKNPEIYDDEFNAEDDAADMQRRAQGTAIYKIELIEGDDEE